MSAHNTSPESVLLLVQHLQQELQNQRVEIQSLRTALNTSRNDSSSPPSSRVRLPDPPRFNGKPYTLRTWLPSIRAKLRSDRLTGANAFNYRLCHNPQEQQEAIRRFASVRQKDDKSLLAYLAYFKRLSHKAGTRSLRAALRQHLKESNDSLFSIRYNNYVKLHRTNHDLCYCCGSNQHWIKDCSQARPKLLLNQPSQPPQKKLTACRTGSPHLRYSP
ncbi:hypothetical protein BDW02DRAFT_574963 [Decorospora gaudefroyi]|uniref:CCHC-type domain-containing protein n=1 Tax=Decorospora gaudefroyi TaxID=184978 RepID=A0A6A5JWJ4_9PLEO|nr:hypothetical protein BDW02DRAFT_574963 [Decorospora gaudefroyi]